MAKEPKFYVVWRGREPGVFETWADCQSQIHGFSGAEYKSFPSRAQAEEAFSRTYDEYKSTGGSSAKKVPKLTINELRERGVQLDSLCVDAACSGNPGAMEYRGVELSSGAMLFQRGPYPDATVNLGEFLAIVEGLVHLKREGKSWPIYSDSRTAIAWVRNRQIKTTLPRRATNRKVFELIDRALAWLTKNSYSTRVLKWKTDEWGEIPADFGRK
ncbi:MAG: ribonuclease H family protein [Planctomycetales bacterium]|nr:ribonuclease H family protein [Planctomycetales bacterium]